MCHLKCQEAGDKNAISIIASGQDAALIKGGKEVWEFLLGDDIYKAWTGRDPDSYRKLAWWDRALSIASLIPWGKAVKGGKLALKYGDDLVRGGSKVASKADDAAKAGSKAKKAISKTDDAAEIAAKKSGKRPSWRESEIDVGKDYHGYDPQKSFINGEEVPYGTKGSTRPEYYKPGHSVEVKNYNIQNNAGKNNLINNVSNQVKDRVTNLPQGTNQTIVIDIRGQDVSNDILREIRQKIIDKSGVNLEIIFKR
ncbi:hypothetical protein RyT2_20600 [Pseudolactococcus yaeyamensis]